MRSLGVVGISLSLLAASMDGPPVVRARHNRVQDSPVAPVIGEHVRARANDTYGKLPLYFEANRGQTDDRVKFLARGRNYTMFLTPTETVLVLSERQAPAGREQHFRRRRSVDRTDMRQTVIRTAFVGANPQPRVVGVDELQRKANYFIGNDPAKWRSNVPTYARVRYQDLYPGIDLVYYGRERALEYDFIVHPGADPKKIVLGFTGTDKVEINADGDLVVHTGEKAMRHRKPTIYQEVEGGGIRQIDGGFFLRADDRVGFQMADYDAGQRLVIDPAVLFYSTYLGGSQAEQGFIIAVDGDGNAYTSGTTLSTDFPTTAGAYLTTFANSNGYSFVTKINPTGSGLIYSSYFGASTGNSAINGMTVDATGNAFLTGETQASDFPTTTGAFQVTYTGGINGFVTKLNSSGSGLVYSTYLGGTMPEELTRGIGIAVDTAGNAYVTGQTVSEDFPTTALAFQKTNPGGSGSDSAFVTKLNAAGSSLVYSTYLGPTNPGSDTEGASIALDATGSAYVTGSTNSTKFPTTVGSFQSTYGGGLFDGFVTKLDPTGALLVYSSYLGGSDNDQAISIAVDGMRNAYITGATNSSDFPTTAGAFQSTSAGGFDAFVTKLDLSGAGAVYSTYLGGSADDIGGGIAVNGAGEAYVTGSTFSMDFPIVNGFQRTLQGFADAFVTKFNDAGSALTYSTYLGGSGGDGANDIALDAFPVPNAYVIGTTSSANFPTSAGAFQSSTGGSGDAFVAKIAEGNPTAGPFTNRVTGGGTINVAGGIRTFDFIIQRSTSGALTGRLQYINHASGARVVSDAYASLMIVGNTATFNGTCGTACSFTVNVIDNGEPGTTDTFTISVSNGPTEGGPLRSGNILIQ